MSEDLGVAVLDLSADQSGLDKGLGKAQSTTRQKMAKIGGLIKKGTAAAAAGLATAGAAAVGAAFKTAAYGDEVAKAAGKAGVGVEQFQELRFAFGQGGIEAATFDRALLKFNKRLGESATTGGTADDAFEALNISLEDADGNVREASGALDEALPKLAEIESDAERAAIAGDLFGQRAGPELAAALSDGIEGIDDARAKAQELGIVMDEDAAAAAEEFTDGWDDIKQSVMGFIRQGATPLMNALSDDVFPFIRNKAIPALSDFHDWIGPKLKRVTSALADFFTGRVVPAIDELAVWWAANGPAIIATAQRVFQGIKRAIDVVVDIVREVIGWFRTMGTDTSSSQAGMLADLKRIWNQLFTTIKGAIDAIVVIVDHGIKVVRAFWDRFGVHIVSFLAETWSNVVQVIQGALDVIMGIVEVFIGVFTGDWSRAWEGIKQIFSGVWNIIQGVVRQALNTIKTVLGAALAVISQAWSAVWNTIKTIARNVWDAIVGRVSAKIDEIRGVIDSVTSTISGAWESAWGGIRDFFTSTWDDMVGAARRKINSIIGFINGLIRAWNDFSLGMDSRSVDMGPLGSFETPGFTIDTPNLPTIPRLAGGGLAEDPVLAMLGEGLNDEAVLPLTDDTFRRLGAEVAAAADGAGMPSELVVRDVDGALIGTMQVEADRAFATNRAAELRSARVRGRAG